MSWLRRKWVLTNQLSSLDQIHTVAFDFDGVFTNNKVLVDQNGRESVYCDRADGLAFDLVRAFKKMGLIDAKFFIISKEKNPVVIARAEKLKLICHHGIDNKLDFFNKYLKTHFPNKKDPFSGVIYLGNDLNDYHAMLLCGFSFAPADSHPKIRELATSVLRSNGGSGVIRELVEDVLQLDFIKILYLK